MPISTGVYSEIIDKSDFTPEDLVAGFFGLFPIFSKRGEDNKIKLKSGLATALREYGEPNYNKYGLAYHFADNWLKGGSSAYMARLLPHDATYSNAILDLEDISEDAPSNSPRFKGEFDSDTPYDAGDIVLYQSSYYVCDIEVSSGNPFTATDWSVIQFGTYSGKLRGEFSVNDSYTAGQIVYRDIADSITFYKARRAIEAGTFSQTSWDELASGAEFIFAEGDYVQYEGSIYQRTSANVGVADPIGTASWELIYYKLKEVDLFSLTNGFSEDMTTPDLIIGTERPHLVFRPMGRGEDYDKLTITVKVNKTLRDTYRFVTYDINVFDKDKNNNTIQVGDELTVSLDPHATDLGGESLFIESVFERYSDLVRVAVNSEALEDVASLAYSKYVSDAEFDVEDIYTIDVLGIGETVLSLEFKGGSEGSLLDAMKRMDPLVARDLLIEFYQGTTDTRISNFKEISSKVIFDANFPKEVKDTMNNFVAAVRPDNFAYISTGNLANEEQVIQYRATDAAFNNRNLSIKAGSFEVYDQYSGKYIRVPALYQIVFNISASWRINGVHVPVAGYSDRGTLIGIKADSLSFNPDRTYQDIFYLNQINPVIKDPTGTFIMGTLTSQRKQSAMSNESIVNMIQVMDVELSLFCERYIYDFITASILSEVNNRINDYFVKWYRNDGIESVEVNVYASALDKKNKQIRVSVTVSPTSFIEKILLTFVIK